jgi:FkbM family methyltransferase
MTLEQLGNTLPARLVLGVLARILAALSIISPKIPARVAKMMRGFFSTRFNNVLHENLFVYSKQHLATNVAPDFIFCNTLINLDLCLNIRDYVQGHFYFSGLPDFFIELVSFSDQRTAFFDLGANMGIISAALSKYIPQENIVAIEPMLATYERLQQVFADNCPRAAAFNLALSSKKGFLDLYIPSSDSGSATASLSPSELVAARRPDIQVLARAAACKPFDDFYASLTSVGRLGFLERHAFKIDVEGHEVEVIEGMKDYLASYNGTVFMVIEVRPSTTQAVHQILTSHGFNLLRKEDPPNNHFSLDLIYLRPSKTANRQCSKDY